MGVKFIPEDVGAKIPPKNGETSEQKLKNISENLKAPIHSEINWTVHDHKYSPSKTTSWEAINESTQTDTAKCKPGIDKESLERGAFKDGKSSTYGKPWKVKEFERDIGASSGKTSRWIRIELSAKTIHGHPITEQELRKLTK